MLKFLRRKNISKVIFWFLVILILPAFVLWGTGSMSGSKENRPKSVGTIDGNKVSFDDFYHAVVGIRCQIVLIYFNQPKIMDAMFQNKELMGKLAWDRLIMTKEADEAKIKVPNNEVVAFVQVHPIFTRNGAFDPKIYEHVLRYNIGLDARGFEEIVRENIRLKRLNDLVAKDVTATDEEVLNEYRKTAQKFKIDYILSATSQFTEKAAASDEAARDYYEKNKEEFELPQKEGGDGKLAAFEDVKESIKAYLAERNAKTLALKHASELRQKILDKMSGDNISFEKASTKLGLERVETPFFSKADYLDGLGEASLVINEVARLKEGEVSLPVEVRSGVIVFRVSGVEEFDPEKFAAEKEAFAGAVVEMKKNKFLGEWLTDLETRCELNIDLAEYEKYYR